MVKKSLVIIFFLAVLFMQNIIAMFQPFWQVIPNNPLQDVHTCAAEFKLSINAAPRVGFFYQQPQPGFLISDKRIIAQVQLQAVLAPQIVDHRPDQMKSYRWVIGYFINEKLAASEAEAVGSINDLQTVKVCGNYVLFEQVKP
jgi:hypothetical protein